MLYIHRFHCYNCYVANKYVLDVNIVKITSAKHIKEGDIIRSEEHVDYVVVSEPEPTEIGVRLWTVFFNRRIILKNRISIKFDGNYSKLDYNDEEYDINPPDQVVDLAHSRLGNTFSDFFRKGSSHFARWCKLKFPLECMEFDEKHRRKAFQNPSLF